MVFIHEGHVQPRLVHGLVVSRAAEGEKIQIGRGEKGREAGVFGWGPQVRVKSRLNLKARLHSEKY